MRRSYLIAIVLFCLAAISQAWIVAVLLLTRQIEALLLGNILASAFWFWSAWACFLRKLRVGFALAGLSLLVSVLLAALAVLDVLELGGIAFLRG